MRMSEQLKAIGFMSSDDVEQVVAAHGYPDRAAGGGLISRAVQAI